MPIKNYYANLDRRYVWHPFTQMRDWVKSDPIVITAGKGAVLRDVHGREYLDANASIWTNVHGHAHPAINRALRNQLDKVAHCSALGLANEPASLLAEQLIDAANPRLPKGQPRLRKVFYSDDGSTAMEAALKMSYEYTRRSGISRKPRFLSLEDAYHGDSIGAVSLGHVELFHRAYAGLLFRSEKVMAPYCYRCPYNRARPERAEAQSYRRCRWECVDEVEKRFTQARRKGRPITAMVVEPIVQGVAGMIIQPKGWLRRVVEIVRGHNAQLIADEVMTGFGRTGSLFACHHEKVQPDLMALAKGMTGGYLPMAATLVSQPVFDAFLGEYAEFKTFFHGHSFTANPLGSTAALTSMKLLRTPASQHERQRLAGALHRDLATLWRHPCVGDVRHVGGIAGVELVADWKTRDPIDPAKQAGIRVCAEMARRGVLTRPIGNVIVIMPPYCTTPRQVRKIVTALEESLAAVLESRTSRNLSAG